MEQGWHHFLHRQLFPSYSMLPLGLHLPPQEDAALCLWEGFFTQERLANSGVLPGVYKSAVHESPSVEPLLQHLDLLHSLPRLQSAGQSSDSVILIPRWLSLFSWKSFLSLSLLTKLKPTLNTTTVSLQSWLWRGRSLWILSPGRPDFRTHLLPKLLVPLCVHLFF